MQIQELGEFGVIDLLNRMVVQQRGPSELPTDLSFDLLVDTGDDTAAWHTKEATELFTTDTVVERGPFHPGYDSMAGFGMEVHRFQRE